MNGGAVGRFADAAMDHAALAAAVVKLGADPDAWRRPARAEFARTVVRAGLRSAPFFALIGAGLGAGVMAQAIRLLREIGEEALVRGVLLRVLIEEIAPLMTGLALLGRAGLAIHAEIAAARRAGAFRALDAMGIDPIAMLVLPRCAGAAVSGAALSAILMASAMAAGYALAETRGLSMELLSETITEALTALGPAPPLVGALKAALYAFASAVAFSRAALDPETEGDDPASAAFFNALVGFVLIAFLFAAAR